MSSEIFFMLILTGRGDFFLGNFFGKKEPHRPYHKPMRLATTRTPVAQIF